VTCCKKIPVFRVLFLTLLLAIGACDDGEQAASHEDSYTVYRHSMDGAPNNLDPVRASSIYANFLVVNLYDTLYRYKYLARPYELEPNLAETLPQVSANGRLAGLTVDDFLDDVRLFHRPIGRDGRRRL